MQVRERVRLSRTTTAPANGRDWGGKTEMTGSDISLAHMLHTHGYALYS